MKTNDDLNLIRGFTEWFTIAAGILFPLYTPQVAEVFEDFETFAVEVFLSRG